MELGEFANSIPTLGEWAHTAKVKFFAWFLHTYGGRDRFSPADLRICYAQLHLDPPSNVSSYIKPLLDKRPREILKDARGYYLERTVRAQFDSQYGQRASTILLDQILSSLPMRVSNPAQRAYLEEALLCFRAKAFRAAVVMTWNLAYDHLRMHILVHRLPTFNAAISQIWTKKPPISAVVCQDDFEEFKEADVLLVARTAKITTPSLDKILKHGLDRRNIAAHPSTVTVDRLQAESHISDLVQNVVLKLPA